MKFQLALLLVSALFSQVLSLLCRYCDSHLGSIKCQTTPINCPDQCASVTQFVLQDGKNSTNYLKTCGVPELCVSWSLNLGEMKLTSSAKCCNSSLCNDEVLPVLPQQRANGRICYSCKANDCSQTVDCLGQENYCISQQVNRLGKTENMKGCAYKSVCDASALFSSQGIGTGNKQCCQGNLCNGAESFTLSFLLMIVPLLSSILFY